MPSDIVAHDLKGFAKDKNVVKINNSVIEMANSFNLG